MNISISVSGSEEQVSGHLYIFHPQGTAEDSLSVTFNGAPVAVLADLSSALQAHLEPDVPAAAAPAESPQNASEGPSVPPMQAGTHAPTAG